jgi:hypothetical protein
LTRRAGWALRALLALLLRRRRFVSPPEMADWQRFKTPLRTVRPNQYRIKPGM